MSNLFKSKFLMGVMIVAVMFVGALAFSNAGTASAADCSITTTLRVGSKGAEVQCLQSGLGLTADGIFGPKTAGGVKVWQAGKGLVADGIFGAKSRAAWTGGTAMSLPAGCTSTAGFSSTTGQSCSSGAMTTTLPAGCTSTVGYSPTTGAKCDSGSSSTVVVSGPLSVMVASSTPASGYIIDNQATADLAHFTFTGTGTVSSVTLKRSGISDQNTFSNIYLFDGVNRLTDGYSFNTGSEIVMNNLNLAVNGSRTIQVKGDASSTASNNSTITVSLASFTPVGGTATAVNLSGNQMWLASGASLATVTFNAANQYAGTTPTVDTGTQAYTVWSQSVQVNTRTVELRAANFRMTGSAPADAFANIRLYVDGVDTGKTATVVALNGSNYAVFDLMSAPLSLTTGSHTLDLRVDVVRGASYNVTTSIQNAADLTIRDPQVGVNVAVGITGGGALPSTGGAVTINAGTGTIVIDPDFQSLSNITGGASNVAIGKFRVTGYSEDVKVQSLSVTPTLVSATAGANSVNGGGVCTGTCGLQNVTLFFNGSQVGSQTTSWTSGAITFTLGSQMIVPAGQVSSLEVRADLRTTGGVNYSAGTVGANLTSVASNAQGQSSKSNVTLPTANITGKTLSIQTGLLAVSKNTGLSNQSATPNTANVKIGSFVLQNQSSSESIRVTSLLVGMTTDGSTAMTTGTTPALTNFSGLKTSETSGSGSVPRQPQASNTFSVDFTIAAGATKTIDIYADTSTATGSSFVTELTVTSIGASSNVSVSQNGNGTAVDGQTITLATGTVTNPPTLLTANSTARQFVPAGNGATDATKATFNIKATGGAATISELKFTVNSQDVSIAAGTWDSVATGSRTFTPTTGADANKFAVGDVVKVGTAGLGVVTAVNAGASVVATITVAGSTTADDLALFPSTVTSVRVGSSTASVVNGVAYLTGLSLAVPNGGSGLTQDVYVSYAPVGTNGVQTGVTSRIALEYIKYAGGGSSVEMCTAAIATCATVISTAITAPTMKLVGSRPTLSIGSSSSTLVVGTVEIGSVTVTANAKGDITLNILPVTIALTNATIALDTTDDLIIRDKDGNVVTTTNADLGSTTGGSNKAITFTGGYQISAGQSQTFHIFLPVATIDNTAGAGTSSVSLSVGAASGLSWTDTGGNASATTGTDVAGAAAYTTSNTTYLYNYPTNAVSISS